MQHSSRVRIERNHGRNSSDRFGSLCDCANDQLVSEVKPIKYTERQHGGSLNVGVFSTVEETHLSIGNLRLPIGPSRKELMKTAGGKSFVFCHHFSFLIFHWKDQCRVAKSQNHIVAKKNIQSL